MFYRNMDSNARTATLLIVSALLLAAGCATDSPPIQSDARYASLCPGDQTPSCVEYLGKAMRCQCSTREGLQEILELNKQ
jgi:hypothetical protein